MKKNAFPPKVEEFEKAACPPGAEVLEIVLQANDLPLLQDPPSLGGDFGGGTEREFFPPTTTKGP